MIKSLRSEHFKIWLIATTVIYICIRLVNVSSIAEPKLYPDSDIYLSVANTSITSEDFWVARVPVVVPLVYKLMGTNTNAITIFQTIFSIIAWTMLGFATSNFFRGKYVKWFAFSAILFFSLSAETLLYDFVILSESISLSLMIIHLSAWMLFLAKGMNNWIYAAGVIISGLLWIFTRDTNTVIMLGLAILVLFFSLLKKSSFNLKIIGAVLIGFCLLSSMLGSSSERWILPNIKVLEQRILTEENGLAFYKANGMPVNNKLMEFIGREGGSIFDWETTPELAQFMEWHKENGKSIYLKYLLSDPLKFFIDPLENKQFLVYADPILLYAPHGFEQILPQGLNEALFFKHLDLKSILFTIFCLSLGLGIFIFKQQVIFITPLIMTSFLYPHALIVWAASGGDINRHAYQFRVQYRLVLILLSIVILGFIVEWIVKEYFSILEKRKRAILFSGIGLSVFSISADFLFNTGDTFSLGYAQIFLLLIGSFLIFGSTYLHLAPDKLKIGLGGELYESDNTKGV